MSQTILSKLARIQFNSGRDFQRSSRSPSRPSTLSGAVSDRYCVASSTKIELSLFPPSLSPPPPPIIVTVTVTAPKSGEHRTNPINDSSGSRKRYDFDPSRQSARRNYDRWPVLRAGTKKNRLDRHFGGHRYGEFAACEPYRVSTIGRPLGCRQIYPEFPCRISRAPSSDAVIRTTVLSVAGIARDEKNDLSRLFIFFYIYIICFLSLGSLLELN